MLKREGAEDCCFEDAEYQDGSPYAHGQREGDGKSVARIGSRLAEDVVEILDQVGQAAPEGATLAEPLACTLGPTIRPRPSPAV